MRVYAFFLLTLSGSTPADVCSNEITGTPGELLASFLFPEHTTQKYPGFLTNEIINWHCRKGQKWAQQCFIFFTKNRLSSLDLLPKPSSQ